MVEASRSFDSMTGGAGVGATAFVGGGVLLPVVDLDGALTGGSGGASVAGSGGAFVDAAPGPGGGAVICVPSPGGGG